MHLEASRKAQDAIITFDLPSVSPLLTGSSSVSGLPLLLQRALAQSGDWTPGPGAPMPGAIRELVLRGPFDGSAGPDLVSFGSRPLNPGEEEVVIPMPLWAQMGRGRLSETDQIMASPLAPAGYAPPMGVYRLVMPSGGVVDMSGGAPPGTPGVIELAGPTGLDIALDRRLGAVLASSLGGRQVLARVAIDDGQTVVTSRGRIPEGSDSAPAIVSSAPPSTPSVDVPSFIDGTNTAPMAGGLTSAMTMAADVDARTSMPSRPSIGQGGTPASPSLTSNSSFTARAQAAGQQQAAGSMPGSPALVSSPAAGSDQALFASSVGGAADGAQIGSAISGMTSASSSATLASREASSSAGTPSFITGLQPGMWSGHRRLDTSGYQSWSYASGRYDRPQTVGGVDLASLSRPLYPSLPTALRFRYVGAPLWWSRSAGLAGADDDADSSPANRAMRAGMRAANSAASIWRSILIASPRWGGPDDLSGGMDAGRDANADEMSSLSRQLDALSAASLVTGGGVAGAAAGAGGGPAYVAVTGSGSAGALTRGQAAKARADALEMSIVAAIPPAPPPLESMGSGPAGGDAPHARAKGLGHHGQKGKEHEDAVSHSKIEGSVDAIAQRIYHRIRRRIQSDRERFGG
jgi:hypothetical protein